MLRRILGRAEVTLPDNGRAVDSPLRLAEENAQLRREVDALHARVLSIEGHMPQHQPLSLEEQLLRAGDTGIGFDQLGEPSLRSRYFAWLAPALRAGQVERRGDRVFMMAHHRAACEERQAAARRRDEAEVQSRLKNMRQNRQRIHAEQQDLQAVADKDVRQAAEQIGVSVTLFKMRDVFPAEHLMVAEMGAGPMIYCACCGARVALGAPPAPLPHTPECVNAP
jgi:hypothetical protein